MQSADAILKLGILCVDPVTRRVWHVAGAGIRLPARRFLTLLALIKAPGGCSCNQLLSSAWGGYCEKENVRLTVHRLRKDLARIGVQGIVTIADGYRLRAESAAQNSTVLHCINGRLSLLNQVRKISEPRNGLSDGMARRAYTRFHRSVGRSRSSKARSA